MRALPGGDAPAAGWVAWWMPGSLPSPQLQKQTPSPTYPHAHTHKHKVVGRSLRNIKMALLFSQARKGKGPWERGEGRAASSARPRATAGPNPRPVRLP